MSFIGIVDNEKTVNQIKKEIKTKIQKNIEIIAINNKSIENLSKIKFETIVINKKIDNKIMRELLKKAEFLILNSDIEIDKSIIEGINIKTITYGMHHKTTITASSIGEEEIIICIQREIEGIERKKIEPQEVNIKIKNKNIYDLLMKFTINMVYST